MVKKKPLTEKKRPGIYKRIVKWTGLGLLVLLLITSLIFRAPWKVITLLLIILAACAVLPKPYRKWFWLSVAVVVLMLIIWVFLPDDNEGWRPYTFDEELAALEAKYAIPDSQNAAIVYNTLLEDYDFNTVHPDFLDPNIEYLTLHEPWSSNDYPELAKWLKGWQSTIATLIEASKIENCHFPIVTNTADLSKQTDRLSAMRHWAFLLVRAGNNDMAEGRIEKGWEKYLCVGKMGDHMRQQSTLIDILVGIAVESLELRVFKIFTINCDDTEQYLDTIEKAVAGVKYDWNSDLNRILEHEKLMTKNMLSSMLYEVNAKGRTRFSRDPVARLRSEFHEELPPLNYGQRKLIKAGTILAWFGMPSTPQKAGEIIDGSYEDLYAMVEPDFDWQREPPELPEPLSFLNSWKFTRIRFDFSFFAKSMASMLEESYYTIHDQYLRKIAEQRGTLLIIGLRRYKNKTGRWPQKLDEVKSLAPAEIFVDPFNNDSFIYKLTEENFTLYSKGKNIIDEGGKYKRRYGETSEGDDWLIWPPVNHKTKNEKADAQQSNTQKEGVK